MKYKSVLFIVPLDDNRSKDYLAPLGPLYICAVLKKNGIDVEFIDMPVESYSCEEVQNIANSSRFDLVCVTAVSDSRFSALGIIKKINKPVVVGGVHFTFADKVTLESYANVLAVVLFEGEYTLLSICKGDLFQYIKGITYRNEHGEIVRNDETSFVDIKVLPYPARELLKNENYNAVLEGEYNTRCISILTSRGCPNNCVFCANSSYWKRQARFRDPIDVVDEIEHIIVTYGIKGFDIWDDTFTVSKKHVTGICNEIIRRKLDIKFYARVRVNTTDEELLKLMKKAGCVALSFGVETGSNRILKIISKNITFEQVFQFCELVKKHGFHAKAFFMFNHPEEKYSEVLMTLRLMNKLHSEYGIMIPVGMATVYPGTGLEQDMINRGLLPQDFNWNTYYSRKNKFLRLDPKKVYYKNLNLFVIYALWKLYVRVFAKFNRNSNVKS